MVLNFNPVDFSGYEKRGSKYCKTGENQ